MRREATGHDELTSTAGETVRTFVPAPLPPDPPVDLSGPLQGLHERALLACGRLDGVSSLLPDPGLYRAAVRQQHHRWGSPFIALTFELSCPWRQTALGRGRHDATGAWSGQATAAVEGQLERGVRQRSAVDQGFRGDY